MRGVELNGTELGYGAYCRLYEPSRYEVNVQEIGGYPRWHQCKALPFHKFVG